MKRPKARTALVPVDELAKEMDITVEGETIRVSMVDTKVLQAE